MLWGEVLEYWARWQPDKVGLKFEERDFTWAELDRRADELAAGLSNLGVGHGDRVGILLMNRPEFVETAMACMKLGAIGVPINVRFTAPELAFVIGNADCAVVVTEQALAAGLSRTAEERPGMPILDADDGTFDEARVPGGRPRAVELEPDDPLFICYTSGTTGDPKGAVLTHRVVALRGPVPRAPGRHQPPRPPAAAVPAGLHRGPGHDADGAVVGFDAGARAGLRPARAACGSSRSSASRCSWPCRSIFQQLADHPEFDATDISVDPLCVESGGATVPVSLLQTWIDRGIPMTQTYSLTEVSASGITLPYHEAFTRVGFCGVPAMHSQAKIVDEDGNECPPDVVGEIAIKGPEVMVGYWRNPEATAATLRDGWCHTGDLGLRDATGTSRWSTGPRTC